MREYMLLVAGNQMRSKFICSLQYFMLTNYRLSSNCVILSFIACFPNSTKGDLNIVQSAAAMLLSWGFFPSVIHGILLPI